MSTPLVKICLQLREPKHTQSVLCLVRVGGRSTGFVLESFPRTADESALLSESGLFPDAAVVLDIEDTDAVARLLPPRLARWRGRRRQLLERRRLKKERKQRRRETAIDRRRAKLQKEADKRKAEREVR